MPSLQISEHTQFVSRGIAAAERGEYAAALQMLQMVYRTADPEDFPQALSSYAVCLVCAEGKRNLGLELCQKAIQLEPDEGRHRANLVRIYISLKNRKKAVETLEEAMSRLENNPALLHVREEIGYRHTPSLTFLSRTNPLNKLYGRTAWKLRRTSNGRGR
jgi:tetratricopeptide (TPR) repeat protein